MWSFVEKIAAIGKLFGMLPSASAPAVIQMGLTSMGLDPDPRVKQAEARWRVAVCGGGRLRAGAAGAGAGWTGGGCGRGGGFLGAQWTAGDFLSTNSAIPLANFLT